MNAFGKDTVSLILDFDFSTRQLAIKLLPENIVSISKSAERENIFVVDFSELIGESKEPRFLENLLFEACLKIKNSEKLSGMSLDGWMNLLTHFRGEAERGDVEAMNTLAGLLAEQSVVLKDVTLVDEAENWFKMAASNNHLISKKYLSDVWPTAKIFYLERIREG